MTTGNKIMLKRGELLLRNNFSSFPHYYIYIFLTSGVKLHIHLLNVIVQFIVFLTLSTLICRSTDISKCFSESLGIRDNESRLYIKISDDIQEMLRSRGTVLQSAYSYTVILIETISLWSSMFTKSKSYIYNIHVFNCKRIIKRNSSKLC